ncbi:hypothetical protein GF376_01370 [Candidatus Peregrinibacteria bacterium]|nr:hypothetical protein [Candidatus Peregrinibacteria bacterium]
MKLQENEKILKVYHHHTYFFVLRGIKIWLASLPFLFVGYIASQFFDVISQAYIYIAIFLLFAVAHFYDFMIFYLDTLVVTNKRIVHLDWVNLFKYVETQAMLNDIQNIETQENGFMSKFEAFDFGEFILETASTRTTIHFKEAPDPEGIKYFLYKLARKHNALQSPKARVENKNIQFQKKAESQLRKVEN